MEMVRKEQDDLQLTKCEDNAKTSRFLTAISICSKCYSKCVLLHSSLLQWIQKLVDAEELSMVAWQRVLEEDRFAGVWLLILHFNLGLNYV